MFGVVAFLTTSPSRVLPGSEQNKNLFLIIAVASLATIPAGNMVFRKKMERIDQIPKAQRLETYQSAMIIRAAMTEASAFISIIGFMMTGVLYVFIPALISLVVMALFFPTRSKLASELNLSESELGL